MGDNSVLMNAFLDQDGDIGDFYSIEQIARIMSSLMSLSTIQRMVMRMVGQDRPLEKSVVLGETVYRLKPDNHRMLLGMNKYAVGVKKEQKSCTPLKTVAPVVKQVKVKGKTAKPVKKESVGNNGSIERVKPAKQGLDRYDIKKAALDDLIRILSPDFTVHLNEIIEDLTNLDIYLRDQHTETTKG